MTNILLILYNTYPTQCCNVILRLCQYLDRRRGWRAPRGPSHGFVCPDWFWKKKKVQIYKYYEYYCIILLFATDQRWRQLAKNWQFILWLTVIWADSDTLAVYTSCENMGFWSSASNCVCVWRWRQTDKWLIGERGWGCHTHINIK